RVPAEDVRGGVPLGRFTGGDVHDLRDPPRAPPGVGAGGGGLEVDLDDEVDGLGELHRGQGVGDVGAVLHSAGDELAQRSLGVGRVGGADGAGTGLHGLDHGPDLPAADLADDLAGEVEAEGVVQGLGHGERAGGAAVGADLAGAGPLFPGVDGGVLDLVLVLVALVHGLGEADVCLPGAVSTH